MPFSDSVVHAFSSAKNWVSQVFYSPEKSMPDSKPRDVQILPIGTNTKVLRARSWSRLRFEVEYALCRGTTANCYLIEADKTVLIDPPGQGFTNIYIAALENTVNLRKLDYVILGHFSPNRLPTLKALLEFAPQITFVCSMIGANFRFRSMSCFEIPTYSYSPLAGSTLHL